MRIKWKDMALVSIAMLSLLLVTTSLSVWGCRQVEPSVPQDEGSVEETEEEPVEREETITLYFRNGVENQESLVPEQRTVANVTDPLRAAMEELIKGPSPGTQSRAVLPDTVRVLDIGVADGVCTVNVSLEILTDANQVGLSTSSEVLAFAAIANTLTEFEGVNRVRLLVEGRQSGMLEGRYVEDFWGHTGLPEYLERDESKICDETG